MWLDRFSSQSTPNGSPPPPQNRSFSPAPRRPNHLAPPGPLTRPSYHPRSSSLSLISKANSSSASLAGTARIPNGSTLKREISPPPDVVDPLDILQSIIGSQIRRDDTPLDHNEASSFGEKPEALIEDIDFNGLGLQSFAEGEAGMKVFDDISYQPIEECEYVCLTFGGWCLFLSKRYEQLKEKREDSRSYIVQL